MSTFKSTLEMLDSNVYGHHFPVPAEIANPFIRPDSRRVICLINEKVELRSSLMPRKDGSAYILINKITRSKLNLSLGSEATIQLAHDNSQYGMEMPDELAVLFDQDPAGGNFFHALTPGKQRSLIYLVNKVKNPNSRLNKALAIVHHLKEVSGKLDFKLLNETIKYYNAQGKLNS